jgi:septation ring formation regulator EzrA
MKHRWADAADRLSQTKNIAEQRIAFQEMDKALQDYRGLMTNFINSDKIMDGDTKKIVQDDLKAHVSAAQDFIERMKRDVEAHGLPGAGAPLRPLAGSPEGQKLMTDMKAAVNSALAQDPKTKIDYNAIKDHIRKAGYEPPPDDFWTKP